MAFAENASPRPTTPRPLRVTLVDDSDLAQAGIQTLLAPYAERVQVVENSQALAAPGSLDVILFEPATRSTMAHGLLRDLQRTADAVAAVYTWTEESVLPATVSRLTKRLTASQLVVAIEDLASGRTAAPAPADLHLVVSHAVETAPEVVALMATGEPETEPEADDQVVPDLAGWGLTPREIDMLTGIASGKTNADIGAEHTLSINSVKTYIRTAYRKIGCERRSQAMLWAIEHGLGVPEQDESLVG